MASLSFGDAFIDPQEFKKSVDILENSVNALSSAFTALGKNVEENAGKQVSQLRKDIEALSITDEKARKTIVEYEKQLKKLTEAHEKLNGEVKKEREELEKARKEVNSLKKDTDEYTKSTEKSTKAVNKKKEGLVQLASRYLRTTIIVTKLYQVIRRIESAINDSFTSFVDLEQALQQVKAITGATDAQFAILEQSARQLGASTEYTAVQVAGLQKELAKLGFNPNEIISATAAIVNLATATGEDLAASAKIAASTLRAFNMEAGETERLTNVMAGSFVRSGLDLESFKHSMKFAAPMANKLGVDVETTTLIMAKLADVGLKGTQAGTALRNIFSELSDPTTELAKSIGFTVANSEDLVKAFRILQDRGIGLAESSQLIAKTARGQFITIVEQAASIQDLQSEYRSLENEGRRLAYMMRDTLSNDLEIMNSAMDGVGRGLYEVIDSMGRAGEEGSNFRDQVGALNQYLSGITDQLDRVNMEGASFADVITALIIPALEKLSGVPLMRFFGADFSSVVNEYKRLRKEVDLSVNQLESIDLLRVKKQSQLEEAIATNNTDKAASLRLELAKLTKTYEAQSKTLSIDLKDREYRLELVQAEIESIKEQAKEATGRDYDKTVNRNLETGIKLSTGLNLTLENRLKFLIEEQGALEVSIDTYRAHNIVASESSSILEKQSDDVTDFQLKIAKLRAETDLYVATLESQAQFNDKTLVQQAQTAKKISDQKISAMQQELVHTTAILELQRDAANSDRTDEAIATEKAKTQAAIIRERIKLENELRLVRGRQADLNNRQIIAELNTQIKANQLIKEDALKSFEARIDSAREYYNNSRRLINIEEDRARNILTQKFDDNLITQEQYEAELTELTESFVQRRLEINLRGQQELFKLEQENFNQRLAVRRALRDAELKSEDQGITQQESLMKRRLNQMAIERRGLTGMFNERKRLIEEEQNLRVRQISIEAELNRRRAEESFKDTNVDLKQQLTNNQITQEEYEKQRLANLRAFSDQVKTINTETATDIEGVNTETLQNTKDAWHDTFTEIAEVTQQIMGSLFDFLSSKREAELERLTAWEDARLEYVKGNAEAEALVRLQAETRRKEIARKQAKDARAQALFEIALNTAIGISAAIRDGITGIFGVPIIAALGAAQAAAVLAAPLPEFYKGTDNAPEGYAKVDERGQELIYRRKRREFELGSNKGERVTYLDKGDKVLTASQTKKALENGNDLNIGNNHISNSIHRETASEKLVLRATDEDKIIAGINKGLRSLPMPVTNFDERGVSKFIRTRNNKVSQLNKRYKLGG
jgi:TP901 family phage tail tape measure protein